MSLVSLVDATLRIGSDYLLDKANFSISEKQRICLVGRNGIGKSTLLKVINGEMALDDGRLIKQQGLIVSRLEQEPPLDIVGNAYDVVASKAGILGQKLVALKHEQDVNNLEAINAYIEKHDGWALHNRILKSLNLLNLDEKQAVEDLSGGLRRKLSLASALVNEPQLLLLDEPTNHLDIESIRELENFILTFYGSILVISHDRAFCDNVATSIVELDRGKLYSYEGKFDKYLVDRDERLRKEELANKEFDKELASQEAWIRRGVKARLARNEGRVRNLQKMREIRANRRDRLGRIKVQQNEASRSGQIVFELENVSLNFGNKNIIQDFSATIMRQDKIGIIGKNGCGKTSLVKLLLGQLQPNSGKIKEGSNLQIEYFSQYQEQLDLEKTLADNVADGKKDVLINGRAVHIVSYLRDFLFDTRRLNQKVKSLSGGERNRLMLAKIFSKPSNVLILDEPTNDLDLETLDLLEELIFNYQGTVIVISHDRAFIDKIATETYVFEGNGHIESIVGGYKEVQYYYAHKQGAITEKRVEPQTRSSENTNKKKDPQKLTFSQKLELEKLPQKIDDLEHELQVLDEKLQDPAIYKDDGKQAKDLMEKREQLQSKLDDLYAYFEELLSKE